jgi:hypothetical protein
MVEHIKIKTPPKAGFKLTTLYLIKYIYDLIIELLKTKRLRVKKR